MRDWSDSEAKVEQIAETMKTKGREIPLRVDELPDFPYSNFDALSAELVKGNVLMQKFAMEFDADIISILASRWQNVRIGYYPILTFVLPVVGIVLTIFHSWWWLLLIPVGFMLQSRFKTLYQEVLFSAASGSEKLFCFLYYVRQISLVPPDYSESIYWGRDEE